MTTNITRRTALAATTAGLASALVAATSTSSAAPASNALAAIEAHRAAYAAFEAACDVIAEHEANDTHYREVFVPLSIGGAQSARHNPMFYDAPATLHDGIKRRYREAIDKATDALDKVSPDTARAAVAALRKAQAADLRTMRRVIREEDARQEACGYAAAVDNYNATNDAECEALLSLLAAPCVTASDAQAKSAYLLDHFERSGFVEMEHIEALLSSLAAPLA